MKNWQAKVNVTVAGFAKAIADVHARNTKYGKTMTAEEALPQKQTLWQLACQQQLMLETKKALEKAMIQAEIDAENNQAWHK